MTAHKNWLAILNTVILLALLLLSGCGGDNQDQNTVEAPTVPQTVLTAFLQELPTGDELIPAEQVAASDAFLLDVRQPEEYATGFIDGAVNIPVRELTDHLDGLPGQDDPIIIISGDTNRSGLALGVLRLLGYTNVRVMSGGMNGWRAVYLPVVGQPKHAPETISVPDVDPDLVTAVDAFLKTGLEDNWGTLSTSETKDLFPFLLDVRQPDAFARQQIVTSVNIPLQELADNLDQLPDVKPIVVLCEDGYRSAIAMMTIQLAGFSNVHSLRGGINVLHVEEAANAVLEPAFDAGLMTLPDDWGEKTVAQVAQAAASNAVIVDVRAPDDYSSGFIEGALNIPLDTLVDHLNALSDLDAEIVVVSEAGIRSAFGFYALHLLGYQNVSSLVGGITAWTEAGQPLVTEPVPSLNESTLPEFDFAMQSAITIYLRDTLPGDLKLINYEDMVAIQNDTLLYPRAVLLDVREAGEVAQKEVVGAFNLPLREVVSGLERIPFEMPFSD